MSHGERLGFEAYGVAVDVITRHECTPGGCSFQTLAGHILDRLPPGATERRREVGPHGVVTAVCRGTDVAVTDRAGLTRHFTDESLALHTIDGAIRAIVAVDAPGLVFVHAGVVAVDGRAIVLPGRSMTGKTTLVAALVEAGATYLSDEYAPIDAAGVVHPYPRRLSLRVDGGRREVAASQLGGSSATGPSPIGLVATIPHEATGSWHVTDADQAACAEALLDNAVAARIRPAEVLATSALVARSVRYVTGTRGEAADAAQRLIELVMTHAA